MIVAATPWRYSSWAVETCSFLPSERNGAEGFGTFSFKLLGRNELLVIPKAIQALPELCRMANSVGPGGGFGFQDPSIEVAYLEPGWVSITDETRTIAFKVSDFDLLTKNETD